MKPKKQSYILFVFAIHEDPDSFVMKMAEELSMVAMSPDVRYFYGPQSSIFTFSSSFEFTDISNLVGFMMKQDKITFMLLPLDKSMMTSSFSDEVNEHLFGPTPISQTPINVSKIKDINEMKEMFDSDIMDDEDNDDELLVKLRCKSNVPSVNDILDKIKDYGIKSLTAQEKDILDNYSKQL